MGNTKKQSGSSALIILIIVVVVAILGGLGYIVWNNFFKDKVGGDSSFVLDPSFNMTLTTEIDGQEWTMKYPSDWKESLTLGDMKGLEKSVNVNGYSEAIKYSISLVYAGAPSSSIMDESSVADLTAMACDIADNTIVSSVNKYTMPYLTGYTLYQGSAVMSFMGSELPSSFAIVDKSGEDIKKESTLRSIYCENEFKNSKERKIQLNIGIEEGDNEISSVEGYETLHKTTDYKNAINIVRSLSVK